MIRYIDIIFSFFGLIFLSPVFFIISILIKFESKGGVFYKQERIGKNKVSFQLFKFRSSFCASSFLTKAKDPSYLFLVFYQNHL